MLLYWLWYAELKLNNIIKVSLLSHYASPEDIYHADGAVVAAVCGLPEAAAEALEDKDLQRAKQIMQVCRQKNIGVITLGDSAYPQKLRVLEDAPLVLYYRGSLPRWDERAVIGVVGTRKASVYGLNTARRMGGELAACGAVVVSGAAFGIDAMAMEGALEAGFGPLAVLGCGVDVVYPKSNQTLFERVLECGCILSEFAPGTAGMSWNFPRRNRIISGLSDGVLVVEAPEKSGALITAACAVEQGRDVFVTPGNIDVESFVGSNNLLRRGGIAVFSGWDVAREYENRYPGTLRQGRFAVSQRQDTEAVEPKKEEKIQPQAVKKEKTDKKVIDNGADSSYSVSEKTLTALSQQEKSVLALVTGESVAVDEIIAQSGLPMGAVLSSLTMLAMKGIVQNLPGRRVSLKK